MSADRRRGKVSDPLSIIIERHGYKMESIKILVVEDDMDINNLLAKILKKAGYEPVQAYSGSEAWLRLEKNAVKEYSLILLDLMLPGLMGEELIERIRQTSRVPIIVLSAKSSLKDRVAVLDLGADEYLTQPIEKEEVTARVNSALRRYLQFSGAGEEPDKTETICFQNITLHISSREAKVKGEPLALTAHEFDLLSLLMRYPGKVFSRESLYEQIWQNGYYGEDNTVNVHISNLRKKIAALDPDTDYIKTVWGIGFKL